MPSAEVGLAREFGLEPGKADQDRARTIKPPGAPQGI
jgi:hypothetical protein